MARLVKNRQLKKRSQTYTFNTERTLVEPVHHTRRDLQFLVSLPARPDFSRTGVIPLRDDVLLAQVVCRLRLRAAASVRNRIPALLPQFEEVCVTVRLRAGGDRRHDPPGAWAHLKNSAALQEDFQAAVRRLMISVGFLGIPALEYLFAGDKRSAKIPESYVLAWAALSLLILVHGLVTLFRHADGERKNGSHRYRR